MKPSLLLVCLAGTAMIASAQTAPKKPAAPASAVKHPAAATAKPAAGFDYKVPADEKRIPGIPKIAFAVRYQDIKIGTGPEGEAGKMWHVKYKGWRAADGVVFDAWNLHTQPINDKDGKPEMGPDGKQKMTEPEPMPFPQGVGRMIPGFDYAVTGMRVGGKRRLFIPWQMAYGVRTVPDRPDHPGIPAKSDLIFDVELVEVTDAPQMPPMGPRGVNPVPHPPTPGTPGTPGTPSKPAVPGTPATPSTPATPATPQGTQAPSTTQPK